MRIIGCQTLSKRAVGNLVNHAYHPPPVPSSVQLQRSITSRRPPGLTPIADYAVADELDDLHGLVPVGEEFVCFTHPTVTTTPALSPSALFILHAERAETAGCGNVDAGSNLF